LSLRIVDETIGIISSTVPLTSEKKIGPISGIDLDKIEEGVFHVYLEDKETLLGVFEHTSKFALEYGINP
jgi:hypothetical protein